MAQNLQIDPTTKDYLTVKGSPIGSDRVLEAAYIALQIPENNWLYGIQGQGSLLYTLQNSKRTAQVEQSFAAYTTDALNRQLIQTGKATATQVSNVGQSNTGTANQIAVQPSNVQLANQLSFVPV